MLSRIKRILFSRAFFFGSLLLLQIILISFLFLTLSQQGATIYATLTVLSAFVVLWLFSGDLSPSYKMIWGLLIFIFPLLGCFYFLLWNRIKMPRRLQRSFLRIYQQTHDINPQSPQVMDELKLLCPHLSCQAQQLLNTSQAPVHYCYNPQYFSLGELWFEDMMAQLAKAESYIFMEFFIIGPGQVMDRLLDLLEAKVKEGVEVKFLYDDIGSIFIVPPGYLHSIRSRGIDARLFNPITPFLDGFINSRDHRKIVVIDGRVAYTGGCNLADEYVNAKVRFGHWKDTMVRLEGPGVWSLTLLFLQGWDFTTDSRPDYLSYKRDFPLSREAKSGYVQPFGSNPMVKGSAQNAYMQIISRATRYVYITTPYLILDEELKEALCLAAVSGVDVRIITPAIPDKKTVFMLTQSYYPPLVQAGVKIYEYTPGFIHAKMFVSDDLVAVVGTANLDFRSLYLHFECCAEFYGSTVVREVKEDFLNTQAVSHLITSQDLHAVSGCKRLAQAILRLLAPLF